MGIMLWLPLQGAMAASMSICMKEQDRSKPDTSIPTNAGILPCPQEKDIAAKADGSDVITVDQHHNGDHAQSMQGVSDEVTSSLQCNGVSCHASCSTPIPSIASGSISIYGSVYPLSFISRFTSLFPEQLQRPPPV
jgi:hypothetical protein